MDKFDEIHAVALERCYDDAEHVQDVQWIADAGEHGWSVITQNFRLPQVQKESAAIQQHGTKVFCLSKADYPAITQGLIVGRNLIRIYRRSQRRPGCFWRISERPPLKDIN